MIKRRYDRNLLLVILFILPKFIRLSLIPFNFSNKYLKCNSKLYEKLKSNFSARAQQKGKNLSKQPYFIGSSFKNRIIYSLPTSHRL